MEQRIMKNIEKRMEKKYEEMHREMMNALSEHKARADLFLKLVVKMVSSGMGGCLEKTELEAAGLSGDL
ncbi:hypothetical protein BGZ83_005090, partial [Gryganskiella cystojenkinii]